MNVQKSRLIVALTAFSLVTGWAGFAHSTSVTSIKVGIVIGAKQKTQAPLVNRSARHTCGAARVKISQAGYEDIQALDCNGNVYLFLARINSQQSNVGFNAATGQIIKL